MIHDSINIEVSVLITVFNRERLLPISIQSVLNQTYSNFEIIILDDCSSDNSYYVALDYSQKDQRIKVFKNNQNIGQFKNRNAIVSYAKNELLVYLDSDDTLKENALQYIVECFSTYSESSFGMILYSKELVSPFFLKPIEAIRKHFFDNSLLHIGPGGTVIKKSIFNEIGGFPTNYGPVGDMFYNIKATLNSGVLMMPYDYLNYFRHEGQELNDRFSYLYNGYIYFNDIMQLMTECLSKEEIYFLVIKNKRRFFVNSFKYLIETCNISQFCRAYKLARFSYMDILISVFQK